MSQTLYRKYRPQTFNDVVNQNHIKITLQNEILSGQIAHAYLFTGPRGIGKTSLARILAKALNCEKRKPNSFEPCDSCPSCEAIKNGRSFDLIEMDAATHTQVDKVRENIVENVRFAPHGSHYKIFIIDEVHMLSTAAFNALLKTLEEPPEYIVFILCTTEIYKLPETVISRCQRFDFKRVSAEQIFSKLKKISDLEKIKIADEVLKTIALRSGGFFRDAESLLGQIIGLFGAEKKEINLKDVEPILPRSDYESISNLVQAILDGQKSTGVEIVNQLINDGVEIEKFNLDLIDYLRKMLLLKAGLKNKDYALLGLSTELEKKIVEQVEKITAPKLLAMLDKIIATQSMLKEVEIQQLPLEIAIMELTTDNNRPVPAPTPKIKPTLEKNSSTDNAPETTKNAEAENAPVALDKILAIWEEFLTAVQKINHSLPLTLKLAYPLSLNKNQLELGFEFDIHAEKLKDKKCLQLAEETLSHLAGGKIIIKPIILSKEKLAEIKAKNKIPPLADAEGNMDEVLKSFGGKVID